jgi:hypothetical protein
MKFWRRFGGGHELRVARPIKALGRQAGDTEHNSWKMGRRAVRKTGNTPPPMHKAK